MNSDSQDNHPNNEEATASTSVAPAADVLTAADQKITLSLSELKEFMKTTVEDVLKSSKAEETRKQIEEYNTKVADSVKNTQASLIRPKIEDGQRHIDYIKRVLEEDNRRRFQSSEGKAVYSDKGEDFTRAKIIILKKIGLTEEEIAQNLADIL